MAPGLVGGHPVLDLTNTVSWRHDPERAIDRLTGLADVLAWATSAGVLTRDAADALADVDAPHATNRVTGLRDRLYPVLRAVARGDDPAPDALTAVRDDVARALRRAEPAPGVPVRWTVPLTHPNDLADALALLADELLRSPDLARLGECSDPTCGWLYVDRTRGRTRKWCSSGDCGNRARARRHYARTHG